MHKLQIGTVNAQGRETPALIVRPTHFNWFLILFACIFFILLGTFILWDHSRSREDQSQITAPLIGSMVILMGTLGIFIALMRMIFAGSVLTLTPLGVEFPYITSSEFVDWDEILHVAVWELPGGDAISFILDDSVSDASSRSWVRSVNRKTMGYDFSVSIGKQAAPLCELIGFYMNHPSARNEIGTPVCLERYQKYLSKYQ